jgi:sec-independent protein translocase protein TatA
MELAPMHWVVVAVVALLLFGPKKLPELGKGIGEGIKNFKEGLKQGTDTTTVKAETPAPSQTPQA